MAATNHENPGHENGSAIYEFGSFRLDTAQRLLTHSGKSLKLKPKAFEILEYLVRHSNQVVHKNDLMSHAWPDSFVEEANLTVYISSLRRTLGISNGDAEDNGSIRIETFPKIGYRFNANVELLERNGAPVGDGENPVPSSESKSRTWLYVAVPLAAVVTTILVYSVYQAFVKADRLEQTMIAPPGFEHSGPYAISPSGEYVAHTSSKDGKYTLHMTHLPSNSRVQLTPPEPDVLLGMTFARDGNSLFFIRASGDTTVLNRIPILGGVSTKILENVGWQIDLSPKDDSFAFVRSLENGESALMIANSDGSNVRQIAARQRPDIYGDSLAWSPKGSVIALIVGGRIVCVDVDTNEEVTLSEVFTSGIGDGLVWLSDGSGLLAIGGEKPGAPSQIWHVAFPSGQVNRVTNDLNNYGRVDVSADGETIISARYEDLSRLWISETEHETPAPITTAYKHSLNWIRWAPSNRIVFGSNVSGERRDVWIMKSDGTDERQITRDAGNNVMPIVSPDEQYIVFASNRNSGGNFNLWRVNADGTDPQQLTTGPGENQPTISTDGRWVFYTSGEIDSPPLKRTLWRVSINGGDAKQVINGAAYGADISPDGKLLACWFKPNDSSWKIGIFSIDGGSPQKLFDAQQGQPVKWTSDGKGVAYVQTEKNVSNVWVQPLAGGPARKVTTFTSARILQFDWSNDNKIASSRTERRSELVLMKNFR